MTTTIDRSLRHTRPAAAADAATPAHAAGPTTAAASAAPATATGAPAAARARPHRLDRAALRRFTHAAAPPVLRGSMVPRPWVGFLPMLWLLLTGRSAQAGSVAPAPLHAAGPWQAAAARRRQALLALVLAACAGAFTLLHLGRPEVALQGWALLQTVLFVLLFGWVAAGFVTALMGWRVLRRGDAQGLSHGSVAGHAISVDARTAVVMPICNEHVPTVFAGLLATAESLVAAGGARLTEIYLLSDSSDPATRAAERSAWLQLRDRLAPLGLRVHYRWRLRRTARKAGNVADFCRRWGRLHRYMVVLDADSVMSGEAILGLVRLMEAHPGAGIIQSAPVGCGLDTVHARAQQFAGQVTGRLFGAGMQYWQLGESHYWGHNAILRIAPFMQHCALAKVSGRGGLSGEILSHDFVEAALMRRAGWQVWLVPDLPGSYEQQPPHLLAELQRDRRWCQGNLQNARLLAEPGLHRVHRAMLATGAMSYLSAPLWLGFTLLGVALWAGSGGPGALPSAGLVAGAAASANAAGAAGAAGAAATVSVLNPALAGLWLATLAMLLLPRALGVALVLRQRQQHLFGGTRGLLGSALLEALLSALQAPLRMAAHTLFVVGALTGLNLQWKSPPRQNDDLRWADVARAWGGLSLLAAGTLAAALLLAPAMALWLLPLVLPLVLAVPLVVACGRPALGRALRRHGLLVTPEEAATPTVLLRAWAAAKETAKAAAAGATQAAPTAAKPGAAVLPLRRPGSAPSVTARAG